MYGLTACFDRLPDAVVPAHNLGQLPADQPGHKHDAHLAAGFFQKCSAQAKHPWDFGLRESRDGSANRKDEADMQEASRAEQGAAMNAVDSLDDSRRRSSSGNGDTLVV